MSSWYYLISQLPSITLSGDKIQLPITEEYFFMNVPQPCVIFDFYTKKVEAANNAFLKICGIPVEHIRNMYIASLFHESAHLINNYLNSPIPYTKTFLINQYDLDINKIMIFEVIPIIKEEVKDNKKEYKVIFMMRLRIVHFTTLRVVMYIRQVSGLLLFVIIMGDFMFFLLQINLLNHMYIRQQIQPENGRNWLL